MPICVYRHFDPQFFLCLCQNRPIGDLIDRNRFLDLCSPESILKSGFQDLIGHSSIRTIGREKTFEHSVRGLAINLRPSGENIYRFLFTFLYESKSLDGPFDHPFNLVARLLYLLVCNQKRSLRKCDVVMGPRQYFVSPLISCASAS